jgi:hypothetical protein
MSSAKWRPSKGSWGIFGTHKNSEAGRRARNQMTHGERNSTLRGNLTDSISQMQNQLTHLNSHTAGEISRANRAEDRAESEYGRAFKEFGRAGETKLMNDAKVANAVADAGTNAALGNTKIGMQGKATAKKVGEAANQMAAASGIESMGAIQQGHEDAMNEAYQVAAMQQEQGGMQFRGSMLSAADMALQGQHAAGRASDAYDRAGDAWGAAQDTRDAAVGQAQLTQANALSGMAKDISSMTSAFMQATDKAYSSAELDALMSDIDNT